MLGNVTYLKVQVKLSVIFTMVNLACKMIISPLDDCGAIITTSFPTCSLDGTTQTTHSFYHLAAEPIYPYDFNSAASSC